jgi:hypothetical protein
MPSNSEPDDRRHKHQPLDESALEPFLVGRKIVSSTLLGEGKSNSNYDLTLDDGLCCVARVHSGTTAALEAHVAGLVRGRVPVPELLFATEAVTVWEFVLGTPMRDDPGEISATATVLAEVWKTKFASAGQLHADGSIEAWPFGDANGFTKMMLDHPNVRRQLGAELFQGVVHLLEEERRRPHEPHVAHLVHGDFNPTNVFIHEGRVSAVLDWEFAHSGGPWGDIGNLRRHVSPTNRHAISAGLADGGFDVPADWQRRAAVADLGSHLEFLTSARSSAFKATRIELVRELLEMPS